MDLIFAAEQYVQAQAVAAAAQYYASAAMNAANGGNGGTGTGGSGPTSGQTIPPSSINAQYISPQQAVLGQQLMQQHDIAAAVVAAAANELTRDSYGVRGGCSPERNEYNRASRDDHDNYRDRSRVRESRPRSRDRSSRDYRDRTSRRSRSRNRDRDCSPYYNRRNSDWNSDGRNRYRGRSPESDEYDDDDGSSRNALPDRTIMIRGLAQHITENDIRQDVTENGLAAKDIRLIRKKDTGASRGFAFVEFSLVSEAQQWMEAKKGVLMFNNQYRAVMQYSVPRDQLRNSSDWTCIECGGQNFRRRDACFKCGTSNDLSRKTAEGRDISVHPTSTILLRGLDVRSTADSVLAILTQFTTLPIKCIKIGRHPLTNVSLGTCYVELNCISDAICLHSSLVAQPLVIDEQFISVRFSKLSAAAGGGGAVTAAALPNATASAAVAAAQWSHSGGKDFRHEDEIERKAEYSASLYAKTPQEKIDFKEYYRNLYRNGGDEGAAAAEVKSKKVKMQATKVAAQNATAPDLGTVMVNGLEYKIYPPPDVSSYQYDSSSGYYYDAVSGLYYDAASRYYYNSNTQKYSYWDDTHQTFLPAPTEQSKDEEAERKKDVGKATKVKMAKRIAKDMEKWAKTLNQRKDNSSKNAMTAHASSTSTSNEATINISSGAKQGGSEDIAFSMMHTDVSRGSETLPGRGKSETSGLACLASNYSAGSDSEETEEQHSDWLTMVCLLCKRQFPTKEKLTKHNQMSDLHKTNMEKWRQRRHQTRDARYMNSEKSYPDANQETNGGESSMSSSNFQYRDRAKERRDKFGPEIEDVISRPPNKLKEKYMSALQNETLSNSPPPSPSLTSTSNIGSQMLQKMGWTQGLGLGKTNQGRTSIIETQQRQSQAGLGSVGAKRVKSANSDENYREVAKRTMFQRFHDLYDE